MLGLHSREIKQSDTVSQISKGCRMKMRQFYKMENRMERQLQKAKKENLKICRSL